MGIFNFGNSPPTIPADLQAIVDNAKGVVTNSNVIESGLALAVMGNIPNLTTKQMSDIADMYEGAGEVAYGLSGTQAAKVAAALAGADTVLDSTALRSALVPDDVKCVLVHVGMVFAANNAKSQITEALRLAVTSAMKP
jgi:hypothetical protein